MSQTVTLQLSDETFEVICSHAEYEGKSPEHWITETLEQQYREIHKPYERLTASQIQSARERFVRHFGEVDLGYPTGTDNGQMDDDLAHEYVDCHKEA